MTATAFKEYKVWGLPSRIFHWVNFLSVICLVFFGILMMYKKELGIVSIEAKLALKEVHVIIGYVFATNLLLRIIWGFVGDKYARWRYILPGAGFIKNTRNYIRANSTGEQQQYLGHTPTGRLAITFIFILLIVLMSSGLIRAGTDIYYPPFGGYVTEYIAAPDTNPEDIIPYNTAGTDADKTKQLKSFKKPFGVVHSYAAYTLMFMIFLHVFFVIRAEVKQGGGLITAMFTGKKIFRHKPVDLDE
ncbi:MAG: cytochrome b/b6 domain-containing protein [Gammaproteobacteria bacterium]|nr:cytochrome b/b6 domain-containing protein [Gammaproteobacteria bacterium]